MTQAVALAQMGSNNTTFRNRIINGAMMIDQRNAGASVTATSLSTTYTLDRWAYDVSVASKISIQQNAGSVTPPQGFSNYLGVTSLAATSLGAGDYYNLRYRIEGYNFADLNWGTANAQAVTLSFWVRSSLTGTFGGAVANSAYNRSYPFSYTISSANTWEYKTVTIAGDTTGTWVGATNGIGVQILFGLGVGSTYSGTAGSWSGSAYFSATGATSVVGTNGATFYITGVQLEEGTTASPFELRAYTTELQLCQRYCYVQDNRSGASYYVFGTGRIQDTTTLLATVIFPVTMRVKPSLTAPASNLFYGDAMSMSSSTAATLDQGSPIGCAVNVQGSGAITQAASRFLSNGSAAAYLIWSAEL